MQDYYEGKVWKNYPGIWSVLAWVVKNIPVSSRVTSCNSTDSTVTLVHCVQPDGYEDLWPLLIPPMMTLLDDYQAEHKLEGNSKVFELFPSCCTLSHKEPYRGQVFTSSYFPCVSPFIIRCEYYNSPSHSKQASLIYLTLRRRPLCGLSFQRGLILLSKLTSPTR